MKSFENLFHLWRLIINFEGDFIDKSITPRTFEDLVLIYKEDPGHLQYVMLADDHFYFYLDGEERKVDLFRSRVEIGAHIYNASMSICIAELQGE